MAFPGPGPGPGRLQGAPSSVVIRLQPFKMAGHRGRGLPVLAQAGNQVVRIEHGDNPLPLPPGVWPVRVWCSYYGMKVGKAETTVDTRAGYPALLYYAPPHTIYGPGALAFGPVDRQGKAALLGIWVAAFAVVLVGVLVGALIS
ncbi:hypothetical protein BJF79_35975 [Actinomadura sp. CNU-125]|uniref:hypothetical protein n=1 Tax=Actinomadura sp. CNU-125 TaxID=1904961 RepID=UPI0009600B41|nr:hypothetical protein [Actinomadura sp. CNU-125]OLT32465.1 hypothetical protein BJF79_35975 [Actinomadura sp. CNU-125]